jgi:hypothetical protein
VVHEGGEILFPVGIANVVGFLLEGFGEGAVRFEDCLEQWDCDFGCGRRSEGGCEAVV